MSYSDLNISSLSKAFDDTDEEGERPGFQS